MPEPGRHRWSPPKRRRPAIPRKTALIVTGIGLLAGVGAFAVLGDPPAPDRSGLDTTGAAPVTPLPTVLPSPSPSSAPTPAIPVTVTPTPGPRVVAATRTPSSPRTVSSPATDPRYDTCAQVSAAGLGPYRKGRDIEYGWYPDDDNDGWVCGPAPGGPGRVHYRNCDEARAAGVTPLRRGDPGYGRHLDRDGDGVACE
ncbi:MAG TPA: excalibur calcium-binding domain-containing protein [Micromonosporaceae bacterium]|nr:excalibur calcium-binding domain-containing protein [Micromonosporaceae bacterium]